MITKANDTVLDLADPPRVTQVDMFDGTTTTTATTLAQIQANPTRLPNYQTLENLLKIFVPAGTVVPFAGSTAPLGWLLCDGDTFSAGTYPELAVALGGTTLPDLRGCVVAGLDNMNPSGSSQGPANRITNPQADTLGGFYGEEEITLTDDQMPSHDHNATVNESLTVTGSGTHDHTGSTTPGTGSHSHGGWWGSPLSTGASGNNKNVQDRYENRSGGDHSHTITITPGQGGHSHSIGGSISVDLDTEGNDEAHDNIQPTRFLNYIIKAH